MENNQDMLLASRVQIAELVHGYADAVRMNDPARCIALFTQDAQFVVREPEANGSGGVVERTNLSGRDAVDAFLKASIPNRRITPLIHNLTIEIDDHIAHARCVMVGAGPTGKPMFMGAYEDSFRREQRWLFTRRCFTLSGWNLA